MKNRLPRGAGMLCRLVASSAYKQPRKYRRELVKIADNPTLNIDVRLAAAQMEYRLRILKRKHNVI